MRRGLLFFCCALLPAFAQADPVPASERTVILMTVDGFPAWLWNDPTTPVPHLRHLAAEGSVADAMTVSNPTVTWINHTTLVTGVSPRRHGVLFNGLLVRGAAGQPPAIEQWRDKADLVRVPTLYDVAHQAGLKTAEVDWVAILNSGTIDYEFLERPTPGGTIERELAASGRVPADAIPRFAKGANIAFRDMIWTQAAINILKEHHPNLLLFHLLTTDALNHSYGPGSNASFTAYGYADSLVGELMRGVEEAGMKDKVTWLVTTDHGFKKVQRVIDVNVALTQAGVTGAHAIPEGGIAFVYLLDPAKRAETLAKVKEVCAGIEGVDQVLDGDEGPKLGMPTPAENPGMGDVILYAKPGYAFLKSSTKEAVADTRAYLGTHGYPASDPELDGIFFASGYGIKKGVNLGRVVNLDVAPTAAKLLGLTMPGIEGHPIEAALK